MRKNAYIFNRLPKDIKDVIGECATEMPMISIGCLDQKSNRINVF
jgi:hypothetical protein